MSSWEWRRGRSSNPSVLAVVPFRVGQAEEPLLDDPVPAVPHGDGEAQPHLVVAEAGDTILTPAIDTGARLVVGKAVPGVAVRAVILANGAPLALAEVGPPCPPRDAVLTGLTQALLLM